MEPIEEFSSDELRSFVEDVLAGKFLVARGKYVLCGLYFAEHNYNIQILFAVSHVKTFIYFYFC